MTPPNLPRQTTISLCAELLEVLEEELHAIISHDGRRLGNLHEAKLSLVRALEQPWIAQPGIAQPGIEQPGIEQPGIEQPGIARPDLTENERIALSHCRERNQRNGALLEMRRRHADRALRILHHIPDTGATYDRTGAAHGLTTSRYRTLA